MKKSQSDETPILEDQLGLGGVSEAPTPLKTEGVVPKSEEKLATKPDGEPQHKQPQAWMKIGLIVLGVIVLSFIGLIWYGRSQDAQSVKSRWQTVSQAAERVTSEAARSSYDSFDPTYHALGDMNTKLDELQRVNTPRFLGDSGLVAALNKVLNDLKQYVDKAKTSTSDLSRLGSSELDSLKSSATAARLSAEDFEKRSSVTDGTRLSDDFFTLNERLDRLIKAHSDAEDTKKAEADAALTKEEQAKQDKADAEESASRWTQAYIAGNVADMKKYMTAPFTKEYDFSGVTASWRATNYPKSYRRVSTEKKSESYEVVETITFVTKSDYTAESSYTSTFVFLITQDATSKKWLINSQRYQ